MSSAPHQTFKLTPTQRVIWMGQQLHPNTPIYNTAYSFRFRKTINPEAFARAHRRLIHSTDSFRMIFTQENGQPEIHSLPNPLSELGTRNVESLSDEEFDELLNEETSRMLDLASCPWRSTLFTRDKGQFVWHLLHHHLLTDGIGFQVVLRRLGSFYQEEISPQVKSDSISKIFPSFGDWISLHPSPSQQVQTTKTQNSQHSRFYNGIAPTGDPTGERHLSTFDHETKIALESLVNDPRFASFSRDLSLNLILITSLIALLARIEGKSSITIGVAHHGRSSPADKEISGLLISIRPLHVTLDSSDNFIELHEKVRSAYFESAASSDDSKRNQSQEYDVTFNLLNSDVTNFSGIPVESQWLYPNCHETTNRWRIHITVPEKEDWRLISDFHNESFSSRDKKMATANLLRTLLEFTNNPEQTIFSYPLTSPEHFSSSILTAADSKVPANAHLWNSFEAIAKKHPSTTAVQFEDSSLSYQELLESAEEQASVIKAQKIHPITGTRSPEMIQGSLAAMKAGSAFLPIDSRLPRNRIESILTDSQGTSPSDNAYVIYTSGTTGVPNGVAVGHRAVINLLQDMEQRAPLEKGSRCMWWTAVNFDLSIYEVFSAILFGHSLHIPPDEVHTHPELLFEWMQEHEINSAYLPPFMLDTLDSWLDQNKSFPLKRLLVGVEPIQEDLLTSIVKKVEKLRIINGYGPTEATVCTSFYAIDPEFIGTRRTPIGKPLTGNRCYILDSHLNLMPKGAVGELYIAGTGLAHGYWNRPELNESKFLNDPFHKGPERERMYKTGDLARLSDEDQLEFLGRTDSQIKLRGQRIEPAEIEQSIANHPLVQRCLTKVEILNNQEELICYYTSPTFIEEEALYEHATHHLPFQILPKRFHHFTAFPTTTNGKVDIQALKEATLARNHPPSTHNKTREIISPEGPVEEHLLDLWNTRFPAQEISTRDSFFRLGGTSLDAMELTVQICKDFDLDLPLNIIFTKPNIAELSVEIERCIEEEIAALSEEETQEMFNSTSAP